MPAPIPQRILVRGVNWLGDAVMTTPALLRLREHFPNSQITLLTPGKLKDLWQGHPAMNAVEAFDEGEGTLQISRRLRRRSFDLALILPNSVRSAWQCRLAGIPQRIGYAQPWRNFLLTRAVPPRPGAVAMHKRTAAEINNSIQRGAPAAVPPASAHHIHQYLHLVAALGANPEPLPPGVVVPESAVAGFLKKFKLDDGSSPLWLGLNAGAEYGPAKRWPVDRFTEAAIQIQRRSNCRWLIFGVKAETETAARLTAHITRAAEEHAGRALAGATPPVVNLAGATTLGELCAALKLCRVLLTNDSGPMHVAAALGTSVVVPFGSTSPELTGPGLPGDMRHQLLRANAPCSPCFLRECPIDFRCMTGIAVERVVQAVLENCR
jgi:heptosyltransferase-2